MPILETCPLPVGQYDSVVMKWRGPPGSGAVVVDLLTGSPTTCSSLHPPPPNTPASAGGTAAGVLLTSGPLLGGPLPGFSTLPLAAATGPAAGLPGTLLLYGVVVRHIPPISSWPFGQLALDEVYVIKG